MVIETDLTLPCGRTLHMYDTGAGGEDLTIFWHHGTPNIGMPPRPLFRPGVRWISYDRPGYGTSTPLLGRNMASAAMYVARVADTLGINRFAVMGHSSGGPHALACSALLPNRVLAVASVAGLAPFGADGLDWFAGMSAGSEASLRAATRGREAKEKYQASAEFDPESFTPADHAAFAGPWSWFDEVVGPAIAAGPDALIDDDLANVEPWGFDPAQVAAPVLLLHGEADRMVPATHSAWLAGRCASAELWLRRGEGHISVLGHADAAVDWLLAQAADQS